MLIFLVATPVGWFILGAITDTFERSIPRDGGAWLWLSVACLGLFTLIGSPLLVLTLMPYFCASATSLKVDGSAISEVKHHGRRVSFLAAIPAGKPRWARFRAASAAAATWIARCLG